MKVILVGLWLATAPIARADFVDFSSCGTYRVRGKLSEGEAGKFWFELFPATTKHYFVRILNLPTKDRLPLDLPRSAKIRVVSLGGSRVTKALWVAPEKNSPDAELLEASACLKER
jgi:hypothetical protein